jgi:hypothetical protein
LEANCEVDSEGGLADAALAGADGDDVLDLGEDARGGTAGRRGDALTGAGDLEVELGDAEVGEGGADVAFESLREGVGVRREINAEVDGVAPHFGLLDEAEGDDVPVEFWVFDRAQGGKDLLGIEGHRGFLVKEGGL